MQDSEDVNTFICCLGLLLHSELLLEAVTSSQVQDVEKASYQAYTTRYIMAIENENKHPRMPVLLKIIRTLKISADTIFYPEIQHTDREKEQLLHMIQLCGEKEIKIAAATVKALLDAR